MTFRVGQKVVCVDAGDCPMWGALPLRKDSIYTVAAYDAVTWGVPGILLAENDSPHPSGYYQARRFRPIVERKTDISFAHEILRKASKPARAPALSSPQRA